MKYYTVIFIFICCVSMVLSSCSKAVDLSKYADQRSENDEIVCVLKVSREIYIKDIYDDEELTKTTRTGNNFFSELKQLTDNQLFPTNDGQFSYLLSFYPCDISLEFAESVANKHYHKNEVAFEKISIDAYKKALARLKSIDEEIQKYLDETGFGKPQEKNKPF